MLQQSLSEQLTARALATVPHLVGDAWDGRRVPVFLTRLPFPVPLTDDWESPPPPAVLDGEAVAELYGKTPYALTVEPLLLDLLRQPLTLPAPWSGRALLIELNEGVTPDQALCVASLRFALKGVLCLSSG